MHREVVLLGSTGSIGTQAADIVRRNPDKFRLVALAAGGGNPELIARQAIEFGVEAVAVANQAAVPEVTAALRRASESAGTHASRGLVGLVGLVGLGLLVGLVGLARVGARGARGRAGRSCLRCWAGRTPWPNWPRGRATWC